MRFVLHDELVDRGRVSRSRISLSFFNRRNGAQESTTARESLDLASTRPSPFLSKSLSLAFFSQDFLSFRAQF